MEGWRYSAGLVKRNRPSSLSKSYSNDMLPAVAPPLLEDDKDVQLSDASTITLVKEKGTRADNNANDVNRSKDVSELGLDETRREPLNTQEDGSSQQLFDSPPTRTSLRTCDSSSNDHILIPKHAIVDDVKIKFILHPNLTNVSTGSSVVSCSANEGKKTQTAGFKVHGINKYLKNAHVSRSKSRSKSKSNFSSGANSPFLNESSRTPPSEQHIIKTGKEILFDIASGKWNRKDMVIDEETEGTKKVTSKPCSNANCVKAAERERRQREALQFPGLKHPPIIFEDGNLPSYHSLLNTWKIQEEEDKERHVWLKEMFKNGFPDEYEFIKVWREFRKNPQAFGVKLTAKEDLPELTKAHPIGSRVRNVVKPYNKALLVGNAADKRPPVRLAGREYYNPEWKPVKNFQEREKQKKSYEKLRELYPHLPVLKDHDYKMNPLTVKHRMKLAEEWHSLVTAANKPMAVVPMSHYATTLKQHRAQNKNVLDPTAESTELDDEAKTPRYAFATASSMKKSRLRRF